jgi:hypothetical protein
MGHAGSAHHLEVPHRTHASDGTAGAHGAAAGRWANWESPIDAVLVAILAIASLVAAWSAYQAHHWSADQTAEYALTSKLRTESTRQSTKAMQLTVIDTVAFTSYAEAVALDRAELADFYQARFRPDFVPAFNAWMRTDPLNNPDAPSTPFEMREYVLPETTAAQIYDAQGEEAYAHGEESKEHSEEYVLNTVILATVLFFAGIAPRIGWVPARLALMAVAIVFLGFAIIDVATLPVAH